MTQELMNVPGQTFRSPSKGTANWTGTPNDGVRQVDAKFSALLFKQQLTAYVEKIYGMLRDNLKKDISPMLVLASRPQEHPDQAWGGKPV
jgi:hypothetical protein